MKAAVEVLRWSIVVSCVACGLMILWTGWGFIRGGEGGPLLTTVVALVAVGPAAIPLTAAWLACVRRWREFLLMMILAVTVVAWFLCITFPSFIPLLDERPFMPDGSTVATAAFHALFFFASFPFANWLYRQLLRVLDHFFPPHLPVKEWIRLAC